MYGAALTACLPKRMRAAWRAAWPLWATTFSAFAAAVSAASSNGIPARIGLAFMPRRYPVLCRASDAPRSRKADPAGPGEQPPTTIPFPEFAGVAPDMARAHTARRRRPGSQGSPPLLARADQSLTGHIPRHQRGSNDPPLGCTTTALGPCFRCASQGARIRDSGLSTGVTHAPCMSGPAVVPAPAVPLTCMPIPDGRPTCIPISHAAPACP
jgi:hypothetical protein